MCKLLHLADIPARCLSSLPQFIEACGTRSHYRIAETIFSFHADAYFLDIAGGWENNTKADMHEGTRLPVEGLRKKFPGILVCGEMPYDALMSLMPRFHVFSAGGYPLAMKKYVRAFQHLSHPAPGRGSTGVQEFGFGHFDPKTSSLGEEHMPTITIVDDTFEKHRDVRPFFCRC